MRRRTKAGIALAVLGLLGAVVYRALHTDGARAWALGYAREQAARFGLQFEAARLDYRLAEGWFELRGVRLRNAKEPEAPALVAAERVEVQLDWGRLRSVVVERPVVTVVRAADGRWLLPKSEGRGGKFRFDMLPERIAVRHGALRFEDRGTGWQGEIPEWEASNAGGVLTLRAARGRVRKGDREETLEALEFRGRGTGEGLQIDALSGRGAGWRFEASGAVGNVNTPEYDLRVATTMDLGRFTGAAWQGTAAGKLQVSGSGARARVEGSLEAPEVAVLDFGATPVRVTLAAASDEKKIEITRLILDGGWGDVELKGRIGLDPQEESRVEARVIGLELLPMLARRRWALRPASRAEAQATMRWPGLDWEKGTGEAALQLATAERQARVGYVPLAGRAEARWQNEALSLKVERLAMPGAEASGAARISLRSGVLAGGVELEVTDGAAVRAVLPEEVMDFAGSLTAKAALAGTWRRPEAAVEWQADGVAVAGWKGIGGSGRAVVSSRELRVEQTALRWAGAEARVSGMAALTGERALDFRADLGEARIEKVLEQLDVRVPVSGRAEGTVTLAGTMEAPRNEFTLRVRDFEAYRENFGEVEASGTIAGTRLTVTSLNVKGAGRMEGSGMLDLGDERFQLQVNGEQVALRSFEPAEGVPVRGIVNVALTGEGTLAEPRLTARVEVAGAEVKGLPLGTWNAAVGLEGDAWEVKAAGRETRGTVEGTIGRRAPHEAQLRVTLDGTDVKALGLTEVGGNPVLGSVKATVEFRGPLGEPARWRGEAEIPSITMQVRDRELKNLSPLRLRMGEDRLQVEPVEVQLGRAKFRLAGAIPIENKVEGQGWEVAGEVPLEALARWLPEEAGAALEGVAKINGEITGTLFDMTPRLMITFEQARFQHAALAKSVENLKGEFLLLRDGVHLEHLSGTLGGGKVSASGSLPFRVFSEAPEPGPEATLGLVVDKVPGEAIHEGLAGYRSYFSGTLRAEANRFVWEETTAEAVITQAGFQRGDVEFRNQGNLRAVLEDGKFEVRQFLMAGNRTKLEARGFVHLVGDRAVDLRLSGPTDASLLSLLTEGLILSGPAELDVALTGTVDDLRLKGRYSLRDGRFVLDQPPLVAELLGFDLVLEGRTIELQNLTANLNGGKLKGSGRLVSRGRGQTPELQAQLEVDQFYLDYPYGLKTVSAVKLTAAMDGPNLVLGGVVKVVDGGFRDAIDLQLLAQLAAKPPAPKPEESTAWQRRVKLNLEIRTAFPLYFDNNLAQMNADANVRVVGTLARPGLLGRIEVENGGKLLALERTFLMDRGVITFADDTKIDPVFDIAASTRVREYDITMRATGGLRDGTVTLTSDPTASEDQIYSLLFTGTVENSGKPMASAQRGLVSLFGSAIGGRYTLGIQRALGLSDFRVDPSFIANETNPTARLTIGQEVAPGAKIIYSTDLTDSKDQMWVGEYDWRRRVTARFIRQQDNSDRGEIRNKWDLGGGPGTGDAPRRKREAVRVGEVRFEGQTVLPEMELRKALGLKTGKKYDFTKVQKAVDKLGLYFARRGYPEVRTRLERTRRSETVKGRAANYVDLNFNIDAGRRTEFAFEGKEPPKKVREAALRAWRAGVVDTQRERMATDVLRRWLIREGYADAKVAAAAKPAGDGGRRVVFDLETGVHYGKPEIVFTGISPWRANEIRKGLKGQNLDVEMQNEPQAAADFVTGAMRADSFLGAKVTPPRIERDAAAKKQKAVIEIDPGKPYRYGEFRFEGLKVLDAATVEEEFYVYPGDYYTPETRDELLLAAQGAYDRRGYREAAVVVDTVLRPESALVDLVFRVDEGRRNQIQAVRVQGTVNTSEEFVRRRLAVLEKELSDSAKLKQSRKNLIESNAYKLVDVATEPVETKETPRNGETRPVNLAVRLREAKPYRVEYGLLYDSDNGFGFVSDVSARNVLGEARWLGYRFLDDGLKTEHRIYISQPFWGRRNIQTNGYISWQKEQREAFTATGTQYSVEQVVRFAERFDFTYGYQLTNVTVDFGLIPELGFPLSVSARLTPLITTFRRDTRDVILDATKGSFLSNAFEYGPTWLGASSAYYRWYGQAFKYFGLSRARAVPGSFDRKAPRWVYAVGGRAGFVDSIGTSQLIPTELFYAGGGTTVRGFEQDELGPKTPGGAPLGGKSTLVINNEIRTPLWKWFDAVGFVDAGNVFAQPSDFRLKDLRGGFGAGLRVRTPVVLLRFDYGWKIARRPGESAGAFFFSIGQAF